MQYKELFRIEIEHRYFSTGGDSGLVLLPDRATEQRLKKQHLLLKPTTRGIMLLVPMDTHGQAKAQFQPAETYVFDIFPSSGAFDDITALPSLQAGEIQHFSNAGVPDTESQLLATPLLATGFHNGYRLVAKVEILLADALATRGGGMPYTIVFPARTATWKYYFVTDPAITDLAVEARDGSVAFSGQLMEENPSDIVGIALRKNFPDANLFRFNSATPIPRSDRAKKHIQLLRDGHVMINHLPNPEGGSEMVKIIRINK